MAAAAGLGLPGCQHVTATKKLLNDVIGVTARKGLLSTLAAVQHEKTQAFIKSQLLTKVVLARSCRCSFGSRCYVPLPCLNFRILSGPQKGQKLTPGASRNEWRMLG